MTPVSALRSRVKGRVERELDVAASAYLRDSQLANIDFSQPVGEAAIASPDSVSWRIFKNPVSLFIGGVTAVILEFAEPCVRSGVWDHSTFRTDPVTRLKRTGLAAMVTVYGARSVAERMIDMVNRMHTRVVGVTPDGTPYSADDPELLSWVQATANYGFLEAYSAYVAPLSDEDRNRSYAESQTAARLYGALDAPASLAKQRSYFDAMLPSLERSDIVFEFLDIMRKAPALPQPMQLAQGLFIRAAVEITPPEVREILGLTGRYGLRPLEKTLVSRMGARADRLMLRSGPAAQACVRVGLPADYLYRR